MYANPKYNQVVKANWPSRCRGWIIQVSPSPARHPAHYTDETSPSCLASPSRIRGLQFLEAPLNHIHKQISLIIYCFPNSNEMILVKKKKDSSKKRQSQSQVKTRPWRIPATLLRCQPWVKGRFLVHLLSSFSPLFPGISSPNKGRGLLPRASSRPKHPGGSPLALTWPCFQAELEFSIREAAGWAFTKISISSQRLSTRGGFVPRSHLAMSAHTFGDCHNWWRRRGAVIGICWLKPKNAIKHPAMHRTVPHYNESGLKCQQHQGWKALL